MTEPIATNASWTDVPPLVAYAILRLRSAVFVVEQSCVYTDLDGRDVEASADHRWLAGPEDPTRVLAYLRVLDDPQGRRVGRVVTAPAARRRGLSERLLRDVVAAEGSAPLVLDAQTYAAAVYARHGFVVSGPEFLEDDILHVPMRREPS